ncbi:uncharacterized protein LOC120264345 [Dioscorea cayenensis subsp. rotundata]|uniref:Uncharacterized protein LOC120264345 n=1 Tax=Dioscorea cayennensis subsp. rotundata TaxID=55577 RepID=A0AB40BKZ0_DIOCR|nr:uncharacterized protein LOC120264345 [Dioscorea cayenensis subsp. rotundata]
MLRFLLLSALLLSSVISPAKSHGDHGDGGDGSCEADPNIRLTAEFRPGLVTVDGQPDEWAEVEGSELSLLPALDPDADKAYPSGKITVKALHDGSNVFFLMQVDGNYAYSKGENTKCPSVALMFQVGENASYHNMGGCPDMPGKCTSKSCRGHEVDIMHFSIGSAIPGRLYGGNPLDNRDGIGSDRFGHLVDVYSWNPHCRFLDGKGPSANTSNAQNDWQGAWWHSSITSRSGLIEEDSPYSMNGQKGTYYFEFSRPLRTMDHFQQDVQFVIGQPSKVAIALWYPTGGKPWSGSQHYSASCQWLPLEIMSSSLQSLSEAQSQNSWDAATAFSLLLSAVSLCLSIFIGYWVSKSKAVPFTPIDRM